MKSVFGNSFRFENNERIILNIKWKIYAEIYFIMLGALISMNF